MSRRTDARAPAAPVLRHAGSNHASSPATGNRQYVQEVGSGTCHCAACARHRPMSPGWSRPAPLRLWVCPDCTRARKERQGRKAPQGA